MKVHHLNLGTMRPRPAAAMYGAVDPDHRRLVCHCLLVQTPHDGLVLVDTGMCTRDLQASRRRFGRTFNAISRPSFEATEVAATAVEALGFAASDVRHIVMTHLDLDHAGGLEDFPEASVHVMQAELEAATVRAGLHARQRYRPAQWAHGPRWSTYEGAGGEPWRGFEAVRPLAGLPPEILMVPLPGHSPGHAGVAILTEGGWALHCGDAYYHRGQVHPGDPPMPWGLRLFERSVQFDAGRRSASQRRLRELAGSPTAGVTVFCTHDAVELDRALGSAAG